MSFTNSSNIDIKKLKEYIEILEEHQSKCEEDKNFVEAEIAKQKIRYLKKTETEKLLNEEKKSHYENIQKFEEVKRKLLDEFNSDWNNNFNQFNLQFVELEEKLNEKQNEEINIKINEIEKRFSSSIKPSSELLNLEKILNGLIRKKEYIKAHQVQLQINKIKNINPSIIIEEKEKKIENEILKLKQKHSKEFIMLSSKKNQMIKEFTKNREIELDRLNQSFKNKLREIEISHSNEIIKITNPNKYINKKKKGLHLSLSLNNINRQNSISSLKTVRSNK
jgi:hypothetical protein